MDEKDIEKIKLQFEDGEETEIKRASSRRLSKGRRPQRSLFTW